MKRGLSSAASAKTEAVTGRTVGNVVRSAAEAAVLPDNGRITGHSLRAGHITQAWKEGVPDGIIQAHSRNKRAQAFREYVQPQKLVENSPSSELGLQIRGSIP